MICEFSQLVVQKELADVLAAAVGSIWVGSGIGTYDEHT